MDPFKFCFTNLLFFSYFNNSVENVIQFYLIPPPNPLQLFFLTVVLVTKNYVQILDFFLRLWNYLAFEAKCILYERKFIVMWLSNFDFQKKLKKLNTWRI